MLGASLLSTQVAQLLAFAILGLLSLSGIMPRNLARKALHVGTGALCIVAQSHGFDTLILATGAAAVAVLLSGGVKLYPMKECARLESNPTPDVGMITFAGFTVLATALGVPLVHMSPMYIADPMGAIVGLNVRSPTIPGDDKKTVAGSMAVCASACLSLVLLGECSVPEGLAWGVFVAAVEAYSGEWDNAGIAVLLFVRFLLRGRLSGGALGAFCLAGALCTATAQLRPWAGFDGDGWSQCKNWIELELRSLVGVGSFAFHMNSNIMPFVGGFKLSLFPYLLVGVLFHLDHVKDGTSPPTFVFAVVASVVLTQTIPILYANPASLLALCVCLLYKEIKKVVPHSKQLIVCSMFALHAVIFSSAAPIEAGAIFAAQWLLELMWDSFTASLDFEEAGVETLTINPVLAILLHLFGSALLGVVMIGDVGQRIAFVCAAIAFSLGMLVLLHQRLRWHEQGRSWLGSLLLHARDWILLLLLWNVYAQQEVNPVV